MAVCRFFLQGKCRFGDGCKFEHPSSSGGGGGRGRDQGRNQGGSGRSQNPFEFPDDRNRGRSRSNSRDRRGNRNDNRYTASDRHTDAYRPTYSNNTDNGRQPSHGLNARSSDERHNFRLDASVINTDLTAGKDLPEWPFSNYAGAGTLNVPAHMFHPAIEMSTEEMRCEFYLAKLQGRASEAREQEAAAHRAALEELKKVKSDIPAAIRKVVAAKREHPNRWDILDQINKDWTNPDIPINPTRPPIQEENTMTVASPFQQQKPLMPPAFGTPSNFGAPSGFGASSGTPQQSAAPQVGWGQQTGTPFASAAPTSTFQQAPSSNITSNTPFSSQAPILAATNTFGQPSGPSATQSPFGRPSGASATTNPFGQPNGALATTNPLGQPSGAPATANPFGQPSGAPASANPFGQPSQPAFVKPAFGQATPMVGGGFGQPSQPADRIFGGAQQAHGGFGNVQRTQQANGFGQTSGQSTASTNGFGQASGLGQSSGGFAPTKHLGGPGQQPPTHSFGFGATAAPTQSSKPFIPNSGLHGGLPPQNPHQPGVAGPTSVEPKDADPPEQLYGDAKEQFRKAYEYQSQHGMFEGGIIPEVAPEHTWVRYGNMEQRFIA